VYQSLIEAIGDAYDDRRVRHTDRIGQLALFVAIGLAGIGLVTEAFGRVLDFWPPLSATITMVGLIGVFVLLALWAR
jgi:hypothetical protein